MRERGGGEGKGVRGEGEERERGRGGEGERGRGGEGERGEVVGW